MSITQPFDSSSIHLDVARAFLPKPMIDMYTISDIQRRRIVCHPHSACGVSHVTPATQLRELQAIRGRHTRPRRTIVPIFTCLRRVHKDNSHFFRPYLCILRAWIQHSDLVTRLGLWGCDVPISWIAYSMNRERIGALKICAGVYEAPHDQRFFWASDIL